MAEGTIHGNDVIGSVAAIAQMAEDKMGGTSGALYSYVPSAISLHLYF
jgi:hypothetical protein